MNAARLLALASLVLLGCASAPRAGGVRDIDGQIQRPLDGGQDRAHVLLFVLADCPIANSYAPEIQAIRLAYEPAGIRFFLVHVQPDLADEAARAHARAYGHTGPILIDRDHSLVRAADVKVTPEAAVFGRDGQLLYRGRIDDLYAEVGKRRHTAATHDLRAALAAIVAGRAVPVARTEAIGCYISDAAAPASSR